MEMGTINWLAVLVAGISSFVVGGIWYSPGLFGKAWMKMQVAHQQVTWQNRSMMHLEHLKHLKKNLPMQV